MALQAGPDGSESWTVVLKGGNKFRVNVTEDGRPKIASYGEFSRACCKAGVSTADCWSELKGFFL